VDRCLEVENALIKTTAMIMRSELNVARTTSYNLKLLLVTNISVAFSSGLSLKEAVRACKNFTDTGGVMLNCNMYAICMD
jgi:ABC-type thiamin/hydroxymethylpyrimidine transport system permease subunit